MAEITFELSKELKAFVESQAKIDGFATSGEFLVAMIRDLRKKKAESLIIEKMREAIESGPAEPMTREDWESIEREAFERITRKKAIS
jgi:Arc/MetJ-type ribon-helix-helix transcriptional regulator